MEHYKISKLLNDSKFMRRKWIEINDSSGRQYSFSKSIRFKSPILRPDLCDYHDLYIAMKGTITIKGINDANKTNKIFEYFLRSFCL